MYADINLVLDKDKSTPRKTRTRRLRTISFIILFVVAVSSLFLFILNLRFSVNSVKKEQIVAQQDLSLFDQNAAKVVFLNLRLDDISSILGSRRNYQEVVESFIKELPQGVSVQSYSIAEKKLDLALSSDSLLSLNEYLNGILPLANSENIESITLNSLTVNNGYIMSIGVVLR